METAKSNVLTYYSQPGNMTNPHSYTSVIKKLPDDIVSLTRIVQGLVIHPFTAKDFYGFVIPEVRMEEAHIRYADKMLDKIFELNDKRLALQRPPEERLVGVCHHFAKLLITFLRTKGIPARMRYGFGAYFNPGYFEDHSLCECWKPDQERWVFVDPQFDAVWQKNLKIKHDVFDVPSDQFIVPSAAWLACRAGDLDAKKFGIFEGNLRGLWFIGGNIIKDVASLNKKEMLQWDAWEGMPKPNDPMKDKKTLQFFDELAILLSDPEGSFNDIKKAWANKQENIKIPGRVFNSVSSRMEEVHN
jgi:hypothetical protein